MKYTKPEILALGEVVHVINGQPKTIVAVDFSDPGSRPDQVAPAYELDE